MNIIVTEPVTEATLRSLNEAGVKINDSHARPYGVVCKRKHAMQYADKADVRWIHILSSGYDDIDVELIRDRGIMLTNSRGVYSIPIAEDIILKMLMLVRRYNLYVPGKWTEVEGQSELFGKTALILGVGSIGSETGKRLSALGVTVIGYDPATCFEARSIFSYIGTDPCEIPQLLQRADYVLLCLPSNNETRHMVDRGFLGHMKDSAFIVNVSRGDIICTGDLCSALKQRLIAGAALDVFEQEPLPEDSELWVLDNIIITPHQAFLSEKNTERNEQLWVENIFRLINGQELLNRIV